MATKAQIDAAVAVLVAALDIKDSSGKNISLYNGALLSASANFANAMNAGLPALRAVGVDPSAMVAALNNTSATETNGGREVRKLLNQVLVLVPDDAGTDPTPDWATRSSGADVARRLMSADATDANLAARHRSPGNNLDICLWVPDENTYTKPVPDVYGLRFDIEQGKGAADLVVKIPPVGKNSKVRAEWVFRANDVFASTVFRMAGGGYPGIKMMIFGTLDASSPSGKLVVTCVDQHKYLGEYRYDYKTGATENLEPPVGTVGSIDFDFDWQPKQGKPATCLYTVSNKTPQGVAVPGCDTLVANQYIRFISEMDTGDVIPGTNGTAWDCEYRLYMAIGNGPAKLVIDYGKTTRGYQGRRAEPWTALWLVPFMTGRDLAQEFATTPSVWFRDLIVNVEDVVVPPQQVSIDSFTVARATITEGETTELAWQTTGVDNVTINGETMPPDGTTLIAPAATKDFTIVVGSLPPRTITVTVQPNTGTPPPFAIPAPGKFKAFTINTPISVATVDVSFFKGILANWCGGVPAPDYGTMGAVVYRGGGEHFSWPDKGGTLVLDLAKREYVMRNLSSVTTHMGVAGTSGSFTDEWGAYRDTKYPQSKHTYNGQCYQPASQGGGPMGSLLTVGQTGGPRPETQLMGDAACWRFDLTYEVDGHSRLNGDNKYFIYREAPTVIANTNDSATSCWDTKREGAWHYARTSAYGRGLSFTHRSGRVDNFAETATAFASWSCMHYMADDDLLVVIHDEPKFGQNRFGCVSLLKLDGPPGDWVTILPTVPNDEAMRWNLALPPGGIYDQWAGATHGDVNPACIQAGYMGAQPSTLLGGFVGFDYRNQPSPNSCRIWVLTPPPAGQRFIGTWSWRVETMISEDGSVMDVRADDASVNGPFGKLAECVGYRSLVWTRGVQYPGVLIRLQGM